MAEKSDEVRKIDNQEALLLMMRKKTVEEERYAEGVMRNLDRCKHRIEQIEAESLRDASPTLRGVEGIASRMYFKAMNTFIPEKYRFEERTQHPCRPYTEGQDHRVLLAQRCH